MRKFKHLIGKPITPEILQEIISIVYTEVSDKTDTLIENARYQSTGIRYPQGTYAAGKVLGLIRKIHDKIPIQKPDIEPVDILIPIYKLIKSHHKGD